MHAATILASYFLVALIVYFSWQMWDRPRPDVVLGGKAAPNLHSFPSGHMAGIAAYYTMLFYYWLRNTDMLSERIFGIIVLTAWIGVVGVARLEQSTHWITDIIAGTAIGLIWFGVLVAAIRKAERIAHTSNEREYRSVQQTRAMEPTEHASE